MLKFDNMYREIFSIQYEDKFDKIQEINQGVHVKIVDYCHTKIRIDYSRLALNLKRQIELYCGFVEENLNDFDE